MNEGTLLDVLLRIEGKLDTLIAALAQDDDAGPTHDLDGNQLPLKTDNQESL